MASIYNMSNPRFGVSGSHPLIPRQQTYLLDRKQVSIHSVDRDVRKWPNANHFEIVLPEAMTNVQSMRLTDYSMPVNFYTFATSYQNTKLNFRLKPTDPADGVIYTALAGNWNNPYVVTISEGFYLPEQMANELTCLFNKAINDYLVSLGVAGTYDRFKVVYHDVQKKFWFTNDKDQFYLDFTRAEEFDLTNCEQPTVYSQYTNWGLGFNLGFDKSSVPITTSATPVMYESQPYVNDVGKGIPLQFCYLGNDAATNTIATPSSTTKPIYYVTAPKVQGLLGDNVIYMEVKRYNQMDELVPFVEATSNLYNNDYGGVVNSAFAKLPITTIPVGAVWDSRNGFQQAMSHFDVPIERISKLEFKFRYHDGRLVEFQECPFNFTLAFYQLKNEIARQYELSIPATYQL